VENRAQFGADGQAVRLSDRVCQGDLVDIERPKLDIAVERHFGHVAIIDTGLA
jgi:hypothetical protein